MWSWRRKGRWFRSKFAVSMRLLIASRVDDLAFKKRVGDMVETQDVCGRVSIDQDDIGIHTDRDTTCTPPLAKTRGGRCGQHNEDPWKIESSAGQQPVFVHCRIVGPFLIRLRIRNAFRILNSARSKTWAKPWLVIIASI